MTQASTAFNSFFGNARTFGSNVVPTRTIKEVANTGVKTAGKVFEPVFTFLEEGDNVFTGQVGHEINSIRAQAFNTTLLMDKADEAVNGKPPKFDMSF